MPGGVPVRSGGAGPGWGDVVGGVFARRSKDWRAVGSGWPRYWTHGSSSRSMVNNTGVRPLGFPKSAVLEAWMQAL